MKNVQPKYALLVLAVLFVASSAIGQPPPPPPPPPPPAVVPLDGGLALLLAGLMTYGVKRFYKNQK